MNRETVYYSIIGSAVVIVGLVTYLSRRSAPQSTLPAPRDLQQQVAAEAPTETKVHAARNLIRHGRAARTEVRQSLERHESQPPAVVVPLLQATAKNRDHRSLPTLVQLLEHPDSEVRGQAGVAVRKILGADFGFRANDPPDKRAKAVAHIKRDLEVAGPRIAEFYGD